MATWLAKNSMLTEKGIEILNKIKAGNGKITVTKVVAGSGRVDDSQLPSVTSVSGTVKPMILDQVSTRESGSEILIYIENTEFTEPFTLQQIGVYVSHPDYSKEVLYHISQCEAEGADIIPSPDETPATLDYSLYLEHGNSDSVVITVDPQGSLSNKTFISFKGNIKPDCIVSSDANGNLKDSGKSISELCNQNLLTNTYFPNPVNRKNGYIVPPNTNFYSDTGLTTKTGSTSTYVKATIVNSTYGYITVSNLVRYVPISSLLKGYLGVGITVDRCRVTDGANVYALLETNGLKFGNTGSAVGYVRLNASVTPIQAIGNKFTLSVITADGRFFTTTTQSEYSGGTNWGLAEIAIDEAKVYVSTSGSDFFGVQIQLPTSKEISIQALKLEFGTQQTLAHQEGDAWVLNEIPNFSEEASKCSQYSLVDDRYLGTIPHGYAEEEVVVQSEDELDSRLKSIFDGMQNNRMKYVLVAFSKPHSVLGSSSRLVQIFRSNPNYGAFRAFTYSGNTNGITLEHTRSIFNGSWTEWAMTYNDHNIPVKYVDTATVE